MSRSCLSDLRKRTEFSDVVFICSDGTRHHVHKVILAFSGFFKNYFLREPGALKEIHASNVDSKVFELYLRYVYGENCAMPDWRTALKFYSFINYTSTPFDGEEIFLTKTHVPSTEYMEYIESLDKIFPEGIPSEIIDRSAKYIDSLEDIAEFDPEYVKVVITSGYFKHQLLPNNRLIDVLSQSAMNLRNPSYRYQ